MINLIPVMHPILPDAASISVYIKQIDANRRYTNFGPLAQQLESRYAEMLEVDRDKLVSVSNATMGLIGAFSLIDVDEWRIPNYTFAATAQSAIYSGKSVRLVDIDSNSWMINLTDTPGSSRSGACVVIPFAATVDLSNMFEHRKIVIDAAASLGNPPKNLKALPSDWSVVFSLHATKVLPAGEGGIVVFGSEKSAEEFRRWTNFGFDSERISTSLGLNAKISELTAACGLASLDGWKQESGEWLRNRNLASEISARHGVSPSALTNDEISPYWIVEFESTDTRNRTEIYLRKKGVETRRWWPRTLNQMPAFEEYRHSESLSNSKIVAGKLLGLPMSRTQTAEEFEMISQYLGEILSPKN